MSNPFSLSLKYSSFNVSLSYSKCPVINIFLLSLVDTINTPASSDSDNISNSLCFKISLASTLECLECGAQNSSSRPLVSYAFSLLIV